MKSEDESKLYYSILFIIFMFLISSFCVLALNTTSKTLKDDYSEIGINYTFLDNQNNSMINLLVSMEEETSDDRNYIDIDYGSKKDDDTALYIKEQYGDVITKYADMYGLDPALVLALATQERGSGHSSKIDDGGAVGIMQIQYNSWINEKIKAYNFEAEEYETIKVDDSIRTLEGNVKVGCMILQSEIKKHDYNIIAGLQSYNYGGSRVEKVIKYYAKLVDKDYQEVIDSNDTDWLDYRNKIVKLGDHNYVENVLRWFDNNSITMFKPNLDEVKIYLK